MKTNQYILVDLLLLGLTIALMILFNVIPGLADLNNQTGNRPSASTAGTGLFWGSDDAETQQVKKIVLNKQTDELKVALESYNKTVAADSTNAGGYYLRALINTQLQRNIEARNDFSKVIKLRPNDFRAYLNRGLVSLKENASLNALIDFTNAIRISPIRSTTFLIVYSVKSIF